MAEMQLDAHNAEEWKQIRTALENPQWDFRTIDGIARETGLDAVTIQEQLNKHGADVRCTSSWARPSRLLYTTNSRKRTLREFLAAIQEFSSISQGSHS